MSHDVNKYRKGILLACAGALLHNLGKVSSRFVEAQVPPKVKKEYKYQHICGLFVEDVNSLGKVTQLPSVSVGKENWAELYKKLKNSPDNKATLCKETIKALKTEIVELPNLFTDRTYPYRIGDLIEYLGQGEGLYPEAFKNIFATSSFLTHLMYRSHHGASGGEKQGILELQQRLPLYLATPLGYEKPAPDLLEYELIKKEVERVIQVCLAKPDSFSLREFAEKLEPLLRRIPADTRRGINDVTVWDIGHTAMAFLKAGIWSLAGKDPKLYQHNYLHEWQDINHPRWRLWRVELEGLDFLSNAVSVADLRVRQRKLREYLDKVRDFAEEKYPVATEVYRDENGSIYIFPDWDQYSVDYIKFKEKVVHIFKDRSVEKTNPAEKEEKKEPSTEYELSLPRVFGLRPATELTEENYYNNPECKGSSTRYIGEKIEEWIGEPLAGQPDFQIYSEVYNEKREESKDKKPDNLCPYCGVRVVGGGENRLPAEAKKSYNADKAKKRKICCVCMYERGQIARDWWTEKPFSTVWVDEVADVNGRVALVVGQISVEKMLVDLIYPPRCLHLAKAHVVRGKLPPTGTNWGLSTGKGTRLYATTSDSFARFRRLWETTAQFWREVAPPEEALLRNEDWRDALQKSLAVEAAEVDGARRRLLLTLKSRERLNVGPYHAYELNVNGIKMGVLCTNPGKREFVTIENLEYIARRMGASPNRVCDPSAAAAFVLTKLMGKKVQLEESLGYGQGSSLVVEKNNEVEIEEVSFSPNSYCPVIPILAEPRVFAALVPARIAFKLVKKIKEKYEKEMGKVRWRLPLALGLVFFEKNTPLRVVLDAGWRMLKSLETVPPLWGKVSEIDRLGYSYLEEITQDNKVNIISHPLKKWPSFVNITVQVEESVPAAATDSTVEGKTEDFSTWIGKELCWKVATTAGDGRTFDIWYPWVKVEGIIQNRALALQDPDPSSSKQTTWLHVMELEKGDKINFFPSTFDFLYLDHAGRRFELAYDEMGRRRGLKRRPYYLEEVDRLAELWELLGGTKGPGETQIHALWELLIGKWQDWQPDKEGGVAKKIWEEFCSDALLNVRWPKKERPGEEGLAKLKAAAKDGTLFDVFELFLTIFKEKPLGGRD